MTTSVPWDDVRIQFVCRKHDKYLDNGDAQHEGLIAALSYVESPFTYGFDTSLMWCPVDDGSDDHNDHFEVEVEVQLPSTPIGALRFSIGGGKHD